MRPPWDEYFLNIARVVATRSTCPRASVGCVLVKDRRIQTAGYNGSLPGEKHCSNVGCEMLDGHCVRTMHAEANAIAQAAKIGASVQGTVCYVTHTPCSNCRKLMASAGVEDVVTLSKYP